MQTQLRDRIVRPYAQSKYLAAVVQDRTTLIKQGSGNHLQITDLWQCTDHLQVQSEYAFASCDGITNSLYLVFILQAQCCHENRKSETRTSPKNFSPTSFVLTRSECNCLIRALLWLVPYHAFASTRTFPCFCNYMVQSYPINSSPPLIFGFNFQFKVMTTH